jgi:hypothetical protein
MNAPTVAGGCLCGAVRYRIDGEPLGSGTCQCRSCRRASAAAIVPWIRVEAERFAFTAGRPVEFSSSPSVTRTFCGRCGTPLTYRRASDGGTLDVTTCSLDDPERFPPVAHVWTSHQLSWIRLADGLPCFAEASPEG